MIFNYAKLRGRIIECCGEQRKFAEKMGTSERTISLKLNNKRTWTQPEMMLASKILHFSTDEIPVYFFKLNGQFD